MRSARRALLSSLSAVLVGVGLASAPAQAQPAASPDITWEQCPSQVTEPTADCGRIDVLMYYSDPEGAQISVGFVRVPAADQTQRRGVLFGNSGGPGGDAYSYFGDAEAMTWPEGITREWDRVAVQPRGLSGSTPVDCSTIAPGYTSDLQIMLQEGAFVRDSCEVGTPGYTASLTTENTAEDWEQVRRALGEDEISIMGLSYGTFLGSVYATKYPQHTDKVVLDSGMDPELAWNGVMDSQQNGFIGSLHDFLDWVAAHNETYGLGETPLAVYQAWSAKVVAESGTNPTVVPPPAQIGDIPPGLGWAGPAAADLITATGGARVQVEGLSSQATNPGAVQAWSPTLNLTRSLLPRPTGWDLLARVTNGSEVAPTLEELMDPGSEEDAQRNIVAGNIQRLIMCNENQVRPDPADIPDYAWANYITGDLFTAPSAKFTSGSACAGAPAVTGLPTVDGSGLDTRPLQIQSTGDPQTPYGTGVALAERMDSHLVTVHGPGHGHVGFGHAEVDDIVVEYLRTGETDVTELLGLV
ncbi:alpha/beta fold hydrolase [Corynebacterium hylobatis]|uniref:Alpha/beta fold hydrolase n=1 Tax=Corynebacterium hylobatis TaxID=1859290 RepID=A0A430HZY9_9CORY|nr:alpha/beta fold hydrolase [Corynebacterium hylobatis]RSZ64491.1 alpha/beta fold hydrolase [Corynebacterium hylobatis]